VFDPKVFLKTLPTSPGIYQMQGEDGSVLYVGKAKNLKNRVSSYFRGKQTNPRIAVLVSRIASIDVTVTGTETEALILEHNLIKQQHPPFNILLRDDKSYPYIFVSDETWPQLAFHRGPKKQKGRYFGPYPSSNAAREALVQLQKVFRVRQCENSFFRNRTRPCLQYQIERCNGPCVGLVAAEEYAEDVENTIKFLDGRSDELIDSLIHEMNEAAESLDYERAGYLRDQIAQLRTVQAEQIIEGGRASLDVIGAAIDGDKACVHMLFIRQGRVIGTRSFYPRDSLATTPAEVIADFLPQFYLHDSQGRAVGEIIVEQRPEDAALLERGLKEHAKRQIRIHAPTRGRKKDWLKLAQRTAEQNLSGKLAGQANYQKRFRDLADKLNMEEEPARLECYDISHTQGNQTVGSCVVFDHEGPAKSHYRKFNIEGIEPGDDYAAMAQVLRRRFTRLKKGEGVMPDLIVVDGGKGQLTQAREVLNDLAVAGVAILGVAKGRTSKSGWERLYFGEEAEELVLDVQSPAFHLLLHIRDEAHRFAIAGHTARRGKKLTQSPLDQVPGIGPKRKKALLQHFGGLQSITSASVRDLAKAPGISQDLAEEIYAQLH